MLPKPTDQAAMQADILERVYYSRFNYSLAHSKQKTVKYQRFLSFEPKHIFHN